MLTRGSAARLRGSFRPHLPWTRRRDDAATTDLEEANPSLAERAIPLLNCSRITSADAPQGDQAIRPAGVPLACRHRPAFDGTEAESAAACGGTQAGRDPR